MYSEKEFYIRTLLNKIGELFYRRKLGCFAWYKNDDEIIVPGRIVQVCYERFINGEIFYVVLTGDGAINCVDSYKVHSIEKDKCYKKEYGNYIEELVQVLLDKNTGVKNNDYSWNR